MRIGLDTLSCRVEKPTKETTRGPGTGEEGMKDQLCPSVLVTGLQPRSLWCLSRAVQMEREWRNKPLPKGLRENGRNYNSECLRTSLREEL